MLAGTLLLVCALPISSIAQEADQDSAAANGYDSAIGEVESTFTGSAQSALTLEGMVLTRSKQRDVPLTASGFNPNNANGAFRDYEYISTQDFGNDVTAGMRGTLRGEMFGQMVEFSAFGMSPMELEFARLTGQVSAANGTPANPRNTNAAYHVENYPDTDADLNSANSENIYAMIGNLQTKLAGGEANIVDPFGVPGLMIGARAIYFGEELGVFVAKNVDAMPGGSATARDRPYVRTDNYLFGLQAGLQGMFDVGGGLSVGGNVKAGIYDNEVERRRTFFSDNQSVRNMDVKDSDRQLSWGFEANPRLNLRLSDNAYLTVAGTFLYLGNVSQAADQFVAVADRDDRDVRANRDVYFYGGSVGMTFLFDDPSTGSGLGPTHISTGSYAGPMTYEDVDERITDLENTTARKGNSNVTLEVSGWINRMIMAYDDGRKRDAFIVDNVASRSRLEFNGYAKIARGWSAGYYMGIGLDDAASNDFDQLDLRGENKIDLRHSAWWLRNSMLGTVTLGYTSTATDNVILDDTGGIMPGAQNIATIGGSLIVRHADEPELGDDSLITRTDLNDFSAGASVDTLRRNNVRYDTPRFNVLGGRMELSAAWGEDDFYDASLWYRKSWNDWRFRGGVGYLRDRTTPAGRDTSRRDREEWKGSASLLHIPSGLFGTVAYVHREFNGFDPSNQAVFGENTTGVVTPPGTNRPPIDYLYTAYGIRRGFSSIGETTIYGEYAQVDDAITGLYEAGITGEVTDSRLTMFGAAISQNIDAAAIDVYAGFRMYQFEAEGVRVFNNVQRWVGEPLTDISIAYSGMRIKF